jgi:acyl-CoA reductase-like NAD-dependent aldehyde dehydrogenase
MDLMTRLVVNPATEEVLAELPQSTVEEIRAAINKAYDAFLNWSETPPKTRAKLMLKAAELLEASGEELVKTMMAESSKPKGIVHLHGAYMVWIRYAFSHLTGAERSSATT